MNPDSILQHQLLLNSMHNIYCGIATKTDIRQALSAYSQN